MARFAIHTHGTSPTTRVFSYKSKITGELTEFCAENGMVTIEGADHKTDLSYYKRENRRELLFRMAALSLELKHMKYGDERRHLQRCIEVMVQVAKTADEQGDPFNDRHMHDMIRSGPARIVVGGGSGRGAALPGYDPGMPAMPRALPNAPYKDLGGTQVLSPSQIIVRPTR